MSKTEKETAIPQVRVVVEIDLDYVIKNGRANYQKYVNQVSGAGPLMKRQLITAYSRAYDELMKTFDEARVDT